MGGGGGVGGGVIGSTDTQNFQMFYACKAKETNKQLGLHYPKAIKIILMYKCICMHSFVSCGSKFFWFKNFQTGLIFISLCLGS